MKLFAALLITFWVIIIVFPAILVFLIGWFFIFIWANLLLFFTKNTKKTKDKHWDEYVKFGNYKIYR